MSTVPAFALRLRPLTPADQAAALAAHRALEPDGFRFLLGHEPGMPWNDLLASYAQQQWGSGLPADRVPAHFLVADLSGDIVGRTSIRLELNEFLRRRGGHIGFGVVPGARRRGVATEILRQSLVIARALGVGRALVTCDDDNAGSAAVIERCGGVFDELEPVEGGVPIRRYWID